MSLQAFSRILRPCGVAASRQFLGRHIPRQAAGHRSIFYTQQKRGSTQEELGIMILGVGLLSSSVVWVRVDTSSQFENK